MTGWKPSSQNEVVTTLLLLAGFMIIALLASVAIANNKGKEEQLEVNSFDECVEAGYPVLETYPRQCRIPGGKTFSEK